MLYKFKKESKKGTLCPEHYFIYIQKAIYCRPLKNPNNTYTKIANFLDVKHQKIKVRSQKIWHIKNIL